MESLGVKYHYDDFTEEHYLKCISLAKEKYYFALFHETPSIPHVYWRHDIDLSPQRALKLAKIESSLGVRATYFLLLHSEFYNLLEPSVIESIHDILKEGHGLGLHFDASIYGDNEKEEIEKYLSFEKNIIETLWNVKIEALSFHNPDVGGFFKEDVLSGMRNVYGETMMREYEYCSDSNGYWRFDRLYDLLHQENFKKLQVLTHPCWWTPDPLSPRERVTRCIEGRAQKTHDRYDAFLKKNNRLNVGWEEKLYNE